MSKGGDIIMAGAVEDSCPPSVLPSQSTSSSTSRRQQSNMSLSQTYFLAQVARHKLMNAARQPDRNLRVLTAHANMLDGLMADLAEAENEQEDWFNQAVSYANAGNAVTNFNNDNIHDTLGNPTSDFDFDSEDDDDVYDEFDDDDDYDECGSDCSCSSGSGSDSGEDIVFMLDAHNRAIQRKRSISTLYNELNSTRSDAEQEEETDFNYYNRDNIQQPPELLHDPDEESDDDSQPSSPRRNSFDFFAASSPTIEETLTSSEVEKGAEIAQSDDNDEDVPLLGYCFSRSSVLHG
ncbi:hypothetical protein H112_05453 [Trichophyton rubrum D6]|uniref:Uncharacterized protein n=4 Tax=Trichophyton TaxID=5550 RepID=A0A178EPT6_TRIRU|nr:uncharacterized protein TERG_03193 [Trichophyton rubrum CBS 118892]EZF17172.1 hypothetical protein H100_05470 [Trichophyton rubrum MR850]EZF40581.1 hypothetical protein H102_05436 [Trichophyton rubrum CBS 100081]EZF51250.1 hypothetical protein H103_05463 [Trichophyton rubrum CBS 288.86]EZF61775.1 hypothetical protein H104_05452 [Trichophyton rubrum CBS 289.86]EZF72433.1 hypothetical protein H105_05479 [Trichophyton soudanense CBS 452.61]EZF83141.1 hypothetical protein H110_05459 [Trichophy